MLLFGDYKCIPQLQSCSIFNFSSLVQGYSNLEDLLPRGVDTSSEENFDMSYFDYIFNNEEVFVTFMTIIMKLYNGDNVYLIVNHNNFYDHLSESLADIIKQRYGIISFFINEMSDYNDLLNRNIEVDFSVPGLYNLDNDKMRLMMIMEQMGAVPVEDYD